MPTSNPWIVCEKSGLWATAFRIAIGREKAPARTQRILEVRSLADLETAITEHVSPVGFVEVRPDNLSAVLEALTKRPHQNVRFIVLLDGSLFGHQRVADALWEAGAAEVIDSPRQMRIALKCARLLARSSSNCATATGELKSIAERAWAALPWQDG